MGRWRTREDVALADCALEIEGADPADVFATAAAALADLMADPATVGRGLIRNVVLEAGGLDRLLFDWLDELIYLKDHDGAIFPEAEVTITGQGPVRLAARLAGGPIEAGRTERRADPKAPTLHRLAVEPGPTGWRAHVVIDI